MTTAVDNARGVMEKFYEVVDRMDTQPYSEFFTPEGEAIFGNTDPVVGPAAIKENADQTFSQLQGISHELLGVWGVDDVIFSKIRVTYTRQDGFAVTLPAATITRMEGDLIAAHQVYVDMAPLFAG